MENTLDTLDQSEVNVQDKIKTSDVLKGIIAELKKEDKTVVHCHGVFDLLHPGHIRHLSGAKKEGDVLVVSITADRNVKRGPGRPIFNEDLRAESLASLGVVDYVCIDQNPTAVELIKHIAPSVYVKGQEYAKKDKDITGKIYDEEDAIKSVGGRLAFTNDITFSSTKLINEYLDVFPEKTRTYLKFISEKYPIDNIVDSFDQMNKLKVLVIGDAIVDQYHYCESMGKSMKEHLVVSKYASEESFAGGVFATANNVAGACGDVHLVSVLGETDSHEDFIKKHLSENITSKFFYRKGAPTTLKRRFVNSILNQKIFEICYMNDEPMDGKLEDEIGSYLDSIIENYDLVVVSDFGHGLMNKGLIDLVCNKSKYMALNVQTNSANTGFNLAIKYPKANYISIDEPEMRLAAHNKHGDLKGIMQDMIGKLNCEGLMVTRGHQGSLYYDRECGFHETPKFSSRVIDRVGAGDAFFAYTSPCMAIDMPRDLMSFIGNAVGALAVQIVCNRNPVDVVVLQKFLTRLLK